MKLHVFCCMVIVLVLFTIDRPLRAQSLYAEMFGNSMGYYTLNYEHPVKSYETKALSVHAGAGFYSVEGHYIHKSIPIGVTLQNRKQGNHHREIGTCLTYVEGLQDTRYGPTGDPIQYTKNLVLLLNVGYAYQRPQGGVILKLYWAPAFVIRDFGEQSEKLSDKSFYHFNGGLAIGYKF
jgi:hypothetical protein